MSETQQATFADAEPGDLLELLDANCVVIKTDPTRALYVRPKTSGSITFHPLTPVIVIATREDIIQKFLSSCLR